MDSYFSGKLYGHIIVIDNVGVVVFELKQHCPKNLPEYVQYISDMHIAISSENIVAKDSTDIERWIDKKLVAIHFNEYKAELESVDKYAKEEQLLAVLPDSSILTKSGEICYAGTELFIEIARTMCRYPNRYIYLQVVPTGVRNEVSGFRIVTIGTKELAMLDYVSELKQVVKGYEKL